MMEVVLTGILVTLCLIALVAIINVLSLRSLGASLRPRTLPGVSVLIPARNEEQNIGRCIASLVDQDYPNYEVLVLDDNSVDNTAAIVREWEAGCAHVRYIKGAPLQSGWTGKNFACYQLAQAAKGELLLFVDADTHHAPGSIRQSVAALMDLDADLLTVLPDEVMKTFWEKVLLPLLYFNLFCFLPLPLVSGSRNPRFAMANGQFMLFRRSAYDAVGGHAAVKDVMVEDVWLSRLVKKQGLRLRIIGGRQLVSCRMYSSLAEIWRGFSKNLFAGFEFSVATMASIILFNIATSVLPYVFLVTILLGGMPGEFLPYVLAQIGVLMAVRTLFSARFGLSYAANLLHPVAVLVVIGIAVNSAWWILVAGGSQWKGRTYRYKDQILAAMKGEQ